MRLASAGSSGPRCLRLLLSHPRLSSPTAATSSACLRTTFSALTFELSAVSSPKRQVHSSQKRRSLKNSIHGPGNIYIDPRCEKSDAIVAAAVRATSEKRYRKEKYIPDLFSKFLHSRILMFGIIVITSNIRIFNFLK